MREREREREGEGEGDSDRERQRERESDREIQRWALKRFGGDGERKGGIWRWTQRKYLEYLESLLLV